MISDAELGAVPREADWDRAPALLEGAATIPLTVEQCDLAYWFRAVAQGTLRGRPLGHSGGEMPDYITRPGPLREALRLELVYRTLDEEAATRVLSHYVAIAPGIPEMEFFATQLLDEARHCMIFRNHLTDLGVPAEGLMEWACDVGADYQREILGPVQKFAATIAHDEGDFIGAVVAFAIIIEGVLAASVELAEHKWAILDPVYGEICRGASIDEIRHLSVGSSIVREHLIAHPESRDHIMSIIHRGRELWGQISDRRFVMHRERLYQEGMPEVRGLLEEHELYPGCLLVDTSPERRWEISAEWNDELTQSRLDYMGLPEAMDFLRAKAPRIL